MERGANDPSFTNLQKICYALGVSSSALEGAGAAEREKGKVLFRREDRSLIYSYESGVRMESLLGGQKQFQICVMTLSAGRTEATTARHSQNEFGILIRGALSITMDGEEYLLGPEDGILIPAGAEHTTRKVGTEECVSVWVKYD